MANVTVKWFGDQKKQEMTQSMERTIIRAGNIIEASQKLLSPVDTGLMRGSIDQYFPDSLTVKVAPNTEYAEFVILGTSRQKAQDFVSPSLFSNINKIIEIAKNEGAKVAK